MESWELLHRSLVEFNKLLIVIFPWRTIGQLHHPFVDGFSADYVEPDSQIDVALQVPQVLGHRIEVVTSLMHEAFKLHHEVNIHLVESY